MTTARINDPQEQFRQSIRAGLAFWEQRTLDESAEVIEMVDRQRENLFRLVRFGLTLPDCRERAARVALQTFDLVEQRGYWHNFIEILDEAFRKIPAGPSPLRFDLAVRLGQLYRLTWQLPDAKTMLTQAEDIAITLDDTERVAQAVYNHSEVYLRERDYPQAEALAARALKLFGDLAGTEKWRAAAHHVLGEAARQRGELEKAHTHLGAAVEQARQMDNRLFLLRFLNSQALALVADGQREQARHILNEAFDLAQELGNELDKVLIQINLGFIYFREQLWDKAEDAFKQANSPYLRRSCHTLYQALVANNLGNVYLRQGRLVEAGQWVEEAIEHWEKIDNAVEQANSIATMGEIRAAENNHAAAVIHYKKALTLVERFPEDANAQKQVQKYRAALAELEK